MQADEYGRRRPTHGVEDERDDETGNAGCKQYAELEGGLILHRRLEGVREGYNAHDAGLTAG